MQLERAQKIAKDKGFSLDWDGNFKLYTLTGNGIQPFGYRASWIAILTEEEYVNELTDLQKEAA